MTTIQESPRKAGKRGKRPARHIPEMHLSNFRVTGAAPPPPAGDVTSGITQFGMDGNDEYGDCGPAATDHYMVTKTGDVNQIGKLGGRGPLPWYFAYGNAMGEPGAQPDEGVDNATWLKFLFNKGVIELFAKIDHLNINEVRQAMLDFRGVLIGVQLTDDAEQLFENHQPWTTANGETADPNEGHDILLVAYGPAGDQFVTWGGLQWSTMAWDGSCIDEAWVVFSKEDAARLGINAEALVAEIQKLGATEPTPVLPTPPAPTPTPTPAPTPAPSPAPPVPGTTDGTFQGTVKGKSVSGTVSFGGGGAGGGVSSDPWGGGWSGTPMRWAGDPAAAPDGAKNEVRVMVKPIMDTTEIERTLNGLEARRAALVVPVDPGPPPPISFSNLPAWILYLGSLMVFVLGVLTTLGVTLPDSVTTDAKLIAGAIPTLVALATVLVGYISHNSKQKAAFASPSTVVVPPGAITVPSRVRSIL